MPVTINGSTGITDADGGVVLSTADFASQAEAEAGTDNTKLMTPLRADQAILAQLNVTGSAPTFACRAWVTFNGSNGSIVASGNVSGVTRNSTGDYTVTFSVAMPDANYAVSAIASRGSSNTRGFMTEMSPSVANTASAFRIRTLTVDTSPAVMDAGTVHAVVFR